MGVQIRIGCKVLRVDNEEKSVRFHTHVKWGAGPLHLRVWSSNMNSYFCATAARWKTNTRNPTENEFIKFHPQGKCGRCALHSPKTRQLHALRRCCPALAQNKFRKDVPTRHKWLSDLLILLNVQTTRVSSMSRLSSCQMETHAFWTMEFSTMFPALLVQRGVSSEACVLVLR